MRLSGRFRLPEPQYSRLLRLVLMTALFVFGTVQSAPAQPLHSLDPGDTLIVGIRSDDIIGLDPAVDTSLNMYVVTGQIYETLTTYDAGSAVLVPGLASSWSVTGDRMHWTFTLRSGVTFQDGAPFNAEAVKYNFERWWDPEHPYHGTEISYPYFESIFRRKDDENGSLISGIDVSTDNTQIILHLSEPYNALPQRLSHPAFAIASPLAIAQETLATHPVGTGAYSFSSWDTIARTILLTENPAYAGAQPFIPQILFQEFGAYEEQVDAIKANTLHVAYGIPNAFYDAARQDINIHVTWQLESTIGYLGMNRTRGPLTSLLVRQAVAHAIDKQALLKNHYDPVDQAADQYLPPSMWGYKTGLVDYAYNPDLSRTLLASAGYPQAFSDPTINIEYRDVYRVYLRKPAEVAAAIRSQLQAVGLQVTVQEDDPVEMIDRVIAGEPEMFLLGWGSDYPHPDNFFYPTFCSDFPLAFGNRDNTFCDALEQTLSKTDPSVQQSDYENASSYIHDQLPVVPLSYGRDMILIRSEVAGLEKASFVPESFRSVFWANGPNEIIRPDRTGSLEVSGYQVLTTSISVPVGAVNDKVTLSYTLAGDEPQTGPGEALQTAAPAAFAAVREPPARMLPAAAQFQISTYKNGVLQPDLLFPIPIDIAIQYDTMGKSIGPETLDLYFWDGSQWVDATTTCTPNSTTRLDLANTTLHVPVCTTGIFGLFGKVQIFLPAVVK